jgi:hypothetical protein
MILRRSRSAAAIGAWSSTWARRWRHRREPNRCRELRIVASPRRLDQTGRHGWGCHRWMLHPIPLLLRRRAIPPPRSEHTAIMVIAEPGCAVQAITGGIHAREPRRIEKPTPAGGYPGSLQYRRAQFRASAGGAPNSRGTASGPGSSVRFPRGASPNRGGFQRGPQNRTANHFLRTENAVSNFTPMPAYTPGQVAHGDHAIVGYTISPSMDDALWKSAQPLGNAASCRFRDG